jgi:hypothetical protein
VGCAYCDTACELRIRVRSGIVRPPSPLADLRIIELLGEHAAQHYLSFVGWVDGWPGGV